MIDEKNEATARLRERSYRTLADNPRIEVIDGEATFVDATHLSVRTADGERQLEADVYKRQVVQGRGHLGGEHAVLERCQASFHQSRRRRFAEQDQRAVSYTHLLADYLSVDRSAMCAELSRMRKEGIIDYRKNVFELGEGSAL